MKKLFLVDDEANHSISYSDLLNSINQQYNYWAFFPSNNLSGFYLNLILGLCNDLEIELKDFNAELEDHLKRRRTIKNLPFQNFKSIAELIDRVLVSKSKIHLYTSGTSGEPKRITHSVQSLINMTRQGEKYQQNVWAMAYNPTHMGGLQVFFQAFLNQNTIINVFEKSDQQIMDQLEKYQVTHLSATPTFYRLLCTTNNIYSGLQRLSIGGEKSDQQLYDQLQLIFPGSKLNNIFSTTEAGTLFVSDHSGFSIPKHLASKIREENGALFIHRSLLGQSTVLNQYGDWYPTGDRIKWIDDNRFCIDGRNSDVVNVGGYQVNMEEVRKVILQMDGIQNCSVYARANSLTGNLICCDLVTHNPNLNVSEIKKKLAAELLHYQLPRIINIVDQVKMTRSGKLSKV